VKKNRGDEPNGIMIHIYVEVPQGNSLCSYLYLKKAKISFCSFFFHKIREQRAEQILPRDGGCWYQWEVARKRDRRVNTV
jgi:hypothetical protein